MRMGGEGRGGGADSLTVTGLHMRMGGEGRGGGYWIHHCYWIAHEDGQGGEGGGTGLTTVTGLHMEGMGRGGEGGVLDSPLLLDCT